MLSGLGDLMKFQSRSFTPANYEANHNFKLFELVEGLIAGCYIDGFIHELNGSPESLPRVVFRLLHSILDV